MYMDKLCCYHNGVTSVGFSSILLCCASLCPIRLSGMDGLFFICTYIHLALHIRISTKYHSFVIEGRMEGRKEEPAVIQVFFCPLSLLSLFPVVALGTSLRGQQSNLLGLILLTGGVSVILRLRRDLGRRQRPRDKSQAYRY